MTKEQVEQKYQELCEKGPFYTKQQLFESGIELPDRLIKNVEYIDLEKGHQLCFLRCKTTKEGEDPVYWVGVTTGRKLTQSEIDKNINA